MITVAVTRAIPEAGLRLLEDASDLQTRVWREDRAPSAAELDELLQDCAGALTLLTDRVDGPVLDRHPGLKIVSNFAVGYDNMDVEAATARGVLVCNTPGVLTETTADFTWALLMAAARRVIEGDAYVRRGEWKTWGPTLLLGRDVHHSTLGIIGFGRIGREVAKRARGFDMEILAFDEYEDQTAAAELGARFVTLEELLRESDFVTLHCALTAETTGLIDGAALAAMKPDAILINAARGQVVDSLALDAALRAGVIAGAAVDVTDPEPLPIDHPLMTAPNFLVAPHIASATYATRDEMAMMAARNLIAGVRGDTPAHCVNPEVIGR